MGIEQRTWVIVETLNQGGEGEKVRLRRISFYDMDAVFSITADEARIDVYRSPDDVPGSARCLVEGTTQS